MALSVSNWLFKRNKTKKAGEDNGPETLEDILSESQLAAITKINNLCRKKHDKVVKALNENVSESTVKVFTAKLNNSPLVINFSTKHLPKIAKDSHYRNQFETGHSSGYYHKQTRAEWESNLFSDTYGKSTKNGFDRPKYGNLMIGRSPQFSYGEAYFILKDNVKDRTTFTLGDSGNEKFSSDHVYSFKYALSSYEKMHDTIDPVETLTCYGYIEIQIHGPIRLDKDVETLYLPKRPNSSGKYDIKDVNKLKSRGINIKYY